MPTRFSFFSPHRHQRHHRLRTTDPMNINILTDKIRLHFPLLFGLQSEEQKKLCIDFHQKYI